MKSVAFLIASNTPFSVGAGESEEARLGSSEKRISGIRKVLRILINVDTPSLLLLTKNIENLARTAITPPGAAVEVIVGVSTDHHYLVSFVDTL